MMYFQSKNEQLVRDQTTNALINKNKLELEQYKAQKLRNEEIRQIKDQICLINERLDKICSVLGIEQEI